MLYIIKKEDGIVLNLVTGEYELNGLTLDFYNKELGIGKLSPNKIKEHLF